MKPILCAHQLIKKFTYPQERTLFNRLSFQVYPGESVAIMGKSGEGKTTLLQILGTLEEATEGHVEINGHLVTEKNRSMLRNQHVGFVFQNFHLLDDYTVLENVSMPAKIGRKNQTLRAKELLRRVGLESQQFIEAKLLSGGEKQRVALARALCNAPDLILADEPTGNLDVDNGKLVESFLLTIPKEENKAVVIVTHDPKLAAQCDRILFLEEGQISQTDSLFNL